jgi:hypothetical protein
MVDIDENQKSSSSTIEENIAEVAAENTWIQATIPTGDIIPGEHGTGNFVLELRSR